MRLATWALRFSLIIGFLSTEATALELLTAGDGKNELNLSSTQGSLSLGSGINVIAFSAGCLRHFRPSYTAGLELDLVSLSYKDYSGTAISTFAVGQYILTPLDYQNSFYGLAGIGIGSSLSKYSTTQNTYNNLGFRIGAGKRTPITKQIIWRPEGYFEKVGDFDGVLILKIINLAYIW